MSVNTGRIVEISNDSSKNVKEVVANQETICGAVTPEESKKTADLWKSGATILPPCAKSRENN